MTKPLSHDTVLRTLALPPVRQPSTPRACSGPRWSNVRQFAWTRPANPENIKQNEMSGGSYIVDMCMVVPLLPIAVLLGLIRGVLWSTGTMDMVVVDAILVLTGCAMYAAVVTCIVTANLVQLRYHRSGWLSATEVAFWTQQGDAHPELAQAIVAWLACPRTVGEGKRARRRTERYVRQKRWRAALAAQHQADRQDLEAWGAAVSEGPWGARIQRHQLEGVVGQATATVPAPRRI